MTRVWESVYPQKLLILHIYILVFNFGRANQKIKICKVLINAVFQIVNFSVLALNLCTVLPGLSMKIIRNLFSSTFGLIGISCLTLAVATRESRFWSKQQLPNLLKLQVSHLQSQSYKMLQIVRIHVSVESGKICTFNSDKCTFKWMSLNIF